MVWIAFATMTAAAVLCIVWPLLRPSVAAAEGAADVAVYRRQIADLDDDVARGMLPAREAAATRAEIGRRLLSAAERLGTPGATPAGGASRRTRLALAVAVAVAVPAVALPLYLKIGMPGYEDLPLAARPAENQSVLAMIERVETHLASHPDDFRGYELIAPVYMQMGRYNDAAHAFAEMLRLKGDTPAREADYGQALVLAADGVVTAEARAAFDAALKGDPTLPQARFFTGMAAEQDGDVTKARAIWTKLVDEAPPDAPWLGTVRRRLAALGGTPATVPPATDRPEAATPPPGAPAGPMAAAIASMPAEQRQAAIRGMVDGLAARLAQNGQDAEGWLRLIRAYTVLGETDKARQALAGGAQRLGQDAAAVGRIDGLARALGLEG